MVLEQDILEELRKIREAVSPKPEPPEPKGLRAEFMDFIGKAGVLGLAVGFIMGSYVGKVVSALVNDIIMPVPGALMGSEDWRKITVQVPIANGVNLALGDFIGVLVDFLIVSIVIFFIAKYARRVGLK